MPNRGIASLGVVVMALVGACGAGAALNAAEPAAQPTAAARPGAAVSPGEPAEPHIATFSIVACDPDTGICGAAVASKYPAVGKVVLAVRAGAGAFCTQHYGRPELHEPALDRLERGELPGAILEALVADDDRADLRQLAIIDRFGRTAQRHPIDAPAASHYWGGQSGMYYACQGNTLMGREVIVAMARAYEETPGSVADRLLAALVAGDEAGGDHRGRLAAGIRVAKPGVVGHWLELDVDESDDAVAELARQYAELDHPAKGAKP